MGQRIVQPAFFAVAPGCYRTGVRGLRRPGNDMTTDRHVPGEIARRRHPGAEWRGRTPQLIGSAALEDVRDLP
jgi:hypothetical protein